MSELFCNLCGEPMAKFRFACPDCREIHRQATQAKKRQMHPEPPPLTVDHPDHEHWVPPYARKRGIVYRAV